MTCKIGNMLCMEEWEEPSGIIFSFKKKNNNQNVLIGYGHGQIGSSILRTFSIEKIK